jgi:hypothetical protein
MVTIEERLAAAGSFLRSIVHLSRADLCRSWPLSGVGGHGNLPARMKTRGGKA